MLTHSLNHKNYTYETEQDHFVFVTRNEIVRFHLTIKKNKKFSDEMEKIQRGANQPSH